MFIEVNTIKIVRDLYVHLHQCRIVLNEKIVDRYRLENRKLSSQATHLPHT